MRGFGRVTEASVETCPLTWTNESKDLHFVEQQTKSIANELGHYFYCVMRDATIKGMEAGSCGIKPPDNYLRPSHMTRVCIELIRGEKKLQTALTEIIFSVFIDLHVIPVELVLSSPGPPRP